MTKNMDRETRERFDALLLSRPGPPDPSTGAAPPPWWRGEQEAAETAAAFAAMTRTAGR